MIVTSRRQRRILTEMHSALRSSDPRMVAGFATFTRLTETTEMPSVERVRSHPVRTALHPWRLASALWRQSALGRRRMRRRNGTGRHRTGRSAAQGGTQASQT